MLNHIEKLTFDEIGVFSKSKVFEISLFYQSALAKTFQIENNCISMS